MGVHGLLIPVADVVTDSPIRPPIWGLGAYPLLGQAKTPHICGALRIFILHLHERYL